MMVIRNTVRRVVHVSIIVPRERRVDVRAISPFNLIPQALFRFLNDRVLASFIDLEV